MEKQESSKSPDTSSENNKKVIKIIIGIVLIVGFLIAASVASVFYFAFNMADAQMEIADQFVSHMAAGEVSDAYQMTNEEFQSVTSEAALFKFLNAYPIIKHGEVSFNQFSIENGHATLSGVLTGNNEATAPLTVWLDEIDGEWTISGLSLEEEDLLE
jgi:hypothetical protein